MILNQSRLDIAWQAGRNAGIHGVRPAFPRDYSEAEQEAYRDGWWAGDTERIRNQGDDRDAPEKTIGS